MAKQTVSNQTAPAVVEEKKFANPVSHVPADVLAALQDEILEDAENEEGFSRDEMATPFIRIAQSLTPQFVEGNEKHIEGLRIGDMFNTVTNEVFLKEEGFVFIPVKMEQSYIKWRPKTAGGGIITDYGTDDSVYKLCRVGTKEDSPDGKLVGKRIDVDEQVISQSYNYFGILVNFDKAQLSPVVVNYGGSNRKHCRAWNSNMDLLREKIGSKLVKPAKFYWSWKITTKNETYAGNTYKVFNMEFFKPTVTLLEDAGAYQAAKQMLVAINNQEVRVDSKQLGADEDIPFDANTIDTTADNEPAVM